MTHKPFVSLNDLTLQASSVFEERPELAERFGRSQAPIGTLIGAQKLGYNITVVPPGKSACPAHNHHVNEEMFLILEGRAELTVGEQRYEVGVMDIIACPTGGPETAHQLLNIGDTDLRYLAVSTCEYPEICDYPNSDKIGVFHSRKDADGQEQPLDLVVRQSDSRDYWEGE